MDKSLRNTLRNVVTQCRKILEEAVAEVLEGQFGIYTSGKLEDASRMEHLSSDDLEYREQLLIHLQHIQAAGTSGKAVKQLEKQIDRQEALISELQDFEEKLRRAANLNLEPDLNDGVVLNIAPLWELVPWSEAKKYWQELTAGKYEWSTIGKQLRAKGIVKC
ncbi:hypothetical protein DSM106972_068120 [Dulcicalothrix desertica PCC 7102]|uniref:Uncharacterized protein n=1 Tax=Dulcicalothrix desertica PCC 7102 TaxID=232991 RepID=A0A3S1AI29_9CYAN|nr:hypothetical protein [Dulcicalothrix desertica]RUT01261.1 hypothetical protein DSM106972_068120 [Dulcicalothrix desertica PCC 7102]TWH40588.1 hypothetical protein CAL7102_09931 [Dulcicalothrix desertica PCC 7102]